MIPLKVIICDDEPLALERLGRMLNSLPEVEVTAKFLSGEDLLARFNGGAEVLLLDVEMPKLDALDVIEALSRREWSDTDPTPLVIFVTAHSEFAVDAFDSGAIDFLTKPVRLSRLECALERARQELESRQARRRLAEITEQSLTLKRLQAKPDDHAHVWVRKGSQKVRLVVSQIDWIAAEGECVRFHCGTESYLERQSISAVDERLGPLGFIRIHRSTVVNADSIECFSRTRWGSLELRLRGGAELRVSKSFESQVRSFLRGSVQHGNG